MNGAHLHLIVNHFPVVGSVLAVLLLAVAVVRWDPTYARRIVYLVVLLALAGIVVYLTGEGAEEVAEDLPGVTESLIEEHEEAALVATILLGLVGAVAAGALFRFRRAGREITRGFVIVLLGLMLIPTIAMAWVSNLGGEIRHSEIRADGGTSSAPAEVDDD